MEHILCAKALAERLNERLDPTPTLPTTAGWIDDAPDSNVVVAVHHPMRKYNEF